MNRPKFRIWDKTDKKWFEPVYEAYLGKLLDISISTYGRLLRRTLEMPAEDESRFEDRYELVQFSGLQDRNNTDIYCGDIIKYTLPDLGSDDLEKDITYIEEVVFADGMFLVEIMPLYATLEFCVEVIGNIYQHKELLNK